MRAVLTALIVILLPFTADAQIFKNLNYQVEGGLGVSVGPNTFDEAHSTINPLIVEHFRHKRFRVPTLRLRSFGYKPVNGKINLGLKTGIDVHYVEPNIFGEYGTIINVPIQIYSEVKVVRIDSEKSIYAGAGVGWNLKKLSHEPFTEGSGMLTSLEISCNANMKRKTFYYKIGFEYNKENGSYHYVPDPSWGTEETLQYQQHRKQLYIAAGINL